MTNNLFNGLQVVSGEVKSNLLNESTDISVSLRGEVELTKGNFEQSFTYWFNNCEMTRYGFIDCDDWDWEENATKLGGLPIDSLHQLKQTLMSSGLTTLANSLNFEESERRATIFLAVENSKGFKKQFGKNAKFWRALTDAEQKLVRLGYVIDNFDTCGEHDKRNFGIKSYDEDGEEFRNYVPTLDELKALKETLTQL
jgi:hypothetical protein